MASTGAIEDDKRYCGIKIPLSYRNNEKKTTIIFTECRLANLESIPIFGHGDRSDQYVDIG